jgi:hypothetical protein
MADSDGPDWIADSQPCRACPLRSDPAARLAAVRRLPTELLPVAMADPDPEVRREVARLIGGDWLAAMAWDRDAGVRRIVAGRLRPEQLTVLAGDSDPRVRAEVAGRALPSALFRLIEDDAEDVQRVARLRLGLGPHPGRRAAGLAQRARRHLM